MSSNLSSTISRIQAIVSRFAPETLNPKAKVSVQADEVTVATRKRQPQTKGGNEADFDQLIERFASRNKVPSSLVRAVIKAESNYNPKAISTAGAKGLMQLMPGTAANLGVQDVFDPAQNIAGGTKYLGDMLARFKSIPKALAAYNAGPGAVNAYNGVPPYDETQTYVGRVMDLQRQYAGRNARQGYEDGKSAGN